MFNFFGKKKISSQEMASCLVLALVEDRIKKPLNGTDDNIILNTHEQSILLLSHLCKLLDGHGLKKVKGLVLAFFVKYNKKVKNDTDLALEMLVLADSIKKIQDFFQTMSAESHIFFKQKFLFDKDLNPMQKTLALGWCTTQMKALDSVFESMIKKWEVKDD
mgnify:CR=1 FL=1